MLDDVGCQVLQASLVLIQPLLANILDWQQPGAKKQLGRLKEVILLPFLPSWKWKRTPFGDKPHIFQDPIFHGTMIIGGRVIGEHGSPENADTEILKLEKSMGLWGWTGGCLFKLLGDSLFS